MLSLLFEAAQGFRDRRHGNRNAGGLVKVLVAKDRSMVQARRQA
jgi:hypothetical protein